MGYLATEGARFEKSREKGRSPVSGSEERWGEVLLEGFLSSPLRLMTPLHPLRTMMRKRERERENRRSITPINARPVNGVLSLSDA